MTIRFARLAAVAFAALSLATSLVAGKPSFAQQPPAGQPSPLAELKLSADQESKMKAINGKYQKEIITLVNKNAMKYKPEIEALQKSTAPMEEKQAKGRALQKKVLKESAPGMRPLINKMFAEMEGVLKPDQKAKFAKFKAKALSDFEKQVKG
jgi:Spy/CpxP family protein refolding chaperone